MNTGLRLSKKGVPHILVTIENIIYSLCWFGKGKFYRVWNYETQEKIIDIYINTGETIDLEKILKNKPI